MPAELVEVHEELRKDVLLLYLEWSIVMQLYGTQKAVELLNRSSSEFFGISQSLWLQEIYLGLSRLTDPIHSAGKDNLCFERYLEHIDESTLANLRLGVADRLKDLRVYCEFARDQRNRKIAHSDLLIKLGRQSRALTPVTKGMIEGALRRMGDLINEVETGYGVPPILLGFDEVGAGTELLLRLRKAET